MKCKKCEEYYIYNDYKFCSICYKQMNGYDYVSIDNIKDCLIKKYINKNKFNLLLKILLGNISKKITLLEVSNLVDDTFLMSNECNIIYGLLKDKITNYSPLGVSEEQQGLQHYWYGSAYNLEHILFSRVIDYWNITNTSIGGCYYSDDNIKPVSINNANIVIRRNLHRCKYELYKCKNYK